MESLADNRLYAWDHNPDYISTFQKEKGRRKRRKRKKKEEKNIGEGRQPPVVPSCAQIMV
jgi:hypothetical protein